MPNSPVSSSMFLSVEKSSQLIYQQGHGSAASRQAMVPFEMGYPICPPAASPENNVSCEISIVALTSLGAWHSLGYYQGPIFTNQIEKCVFSL